ncbi:MAG: TMEM43 family protein [Lysobacteraceae bacterium]
MRRAVALAGLLLAGGLHAQDAAGVRSEPPLRDVEFGVVVRAPGLERRVEMLQWTRVPQGYARAWSDEPVDASEFAPGHANPVAWPLPGRRWLAHRVTLDGHPLDPDVIAALGEWRDFRPSFDALPGNMAATFQPEGDGLGSADNPLDPQVGDLRIRWRRLVLPPLQGRVVLRDGRWQLAPADPVDTDARAPSPPARGPAPAALPAAPARTPWPRWWAALAAVAVAGVVALLVRRRRREP